MSAIVEDGTGKEDAQVYQSETDTATQLTTAGWEAFSLLTPGAQTIALITATAEGDGIAQNWEATNSQCFYGHPINPSQALFFPKQDPINGIPASVILACSLLAEANAIDDTDTGGWNSISPNVAEVNITEEIKVKFKANGEDVTNRTAATLRKRAAMLIQTTCPRVTNSFIVAAA